ncbi:MAG: molybdenum cofactor guanylyltransferase MobA [Alphaproteobacteria bacterium]
MGMTPVIRIAGALLAGGKSARMGGGDKCLRRLGGQTLLERAIARARPQVDELVLNTNGDPSRFAQTGLTIIPDVIEDYAGPLAGILSVLEWARAHRPACTHVVSFATDTPFFPVDLVQRLFRAAQDRNRALASAASGGRVHPVFGLWPVALAGDLRHAMTAGNIRKVDAWTARHGVALAEYPVLPFDPFFNINREDDLARAELLRPITGTPFQA